MAMVVGPAGGVRELPARGNGDAGLSSFSIDGIGALVKPEDVKRLNLGALKGQMVQAVYSVQWRKGKGPLHWLTDCKPVSISLA